MRIPCGNGAPRNVYSPCYTYGDSSTYVRVVHAAFNLHFTLPSDSVENFCDAEISPRAMFRSCTMQSRLFWCHKCDGRPAGPAVYRFLLSFRSVDVRMQHSLVCCVNVYIVREIVCVVREGTDATRTQTGGLHVIRPPSQTVPLSSLRKHVLCPGQALSLLFLSPPSLPCRQRLRLQYRVKVCKVKA